MSVRFNEKNSTLTLTGKEYRMVAEYAKKYKKTHLEVVAEALLMGAGVDKKDWPKRIKAIKEANKDYAVCKSRRTSKR